MATYKVIQDIEAEDKFLGPLTLKQFIFGAAAVFFGYLSLFCRDQRSTILATYICGPGATRTVPGDTVEQRPAYRGLGSRQATVQDEAQDTHLGPGRP